MSVDDRKLLVGRRCLDQEDIVSFTFWTREVVYRGSVGDLLHVFHLQLPHRSVRFEIDVLDGGRPSRPQRAQLASDVVAWLQERVGPRIRHTLADRLTSGAAVRIGHGVLTRDGFGHTSAFHHQHLHAWERFRSAHVFNDTVEVFLTTDDAERGEYGFSVRRASLNSVILPELTSACHQRWRRF